MTYTPTPRTVEIFTEGDCWLLALSLRRLAGIPLVFFMSDGCEDLEAWHHVAVLLPNGNVLDIEGVSTPNKWVDRWKDFDDDICPGCESGDDCFFYVTDDEDEIFDLLDGEQIVRRFSTGDPKRVARRLLDTYAPSLLQ